MAVAPPRLIIRLDGHESVYLLTKPVTVIGRAAVADVSIDDVGLSRAHCEIRRLGGQCRLVDLGSKNGTCVRGRRVTEHVLADGERIEIGRARLFFNRVPEKDRTDGRSRFRTGIPPSLISALPRVLLTAIGFTAAAGAGLWWLVRPDAEEVVSVNASWREFLADCGQTPQARNRDLALEVFRRKYQDRVVLWTGTVGGIDRGSDGALLILRMDPSEGMNGEDVRLTVPADVPVDGLRRGDRIIAAARIREIGFAPGLRHGLECLQWAPAGQ